MKHQTHIATVMLISSSLLCAFILRDIAYPAILCVFGLLGLRRKIILAIQPERRVLTLLILLCLLVLFGLHYRYFTWSAHGQYGPESSMAWHTVTRYFLASMVLMLFLGMPDQLPLSFGFFFVATMVSAGQTFLMEGNIGVFRGLEVVSVVLLLFYSSMSPGSPLRHLLSHRHVTAYGPKLFVAITLFITLNVGWVLGSVIYQRQGAITLLGNFWKNQTALLATPGAISQLGFSRNGRLGTISDLLQSEDLEITLRITSSQTPGYLRAQTFDSYLKGQWHSRSRKDDVRPNSNRLDMSLGEHVGVYRIRNRRDARAESMVVRHVTVLGDATFLPLSIFELAMRDRYLLIDDDFVVFRPQPTTQTAYTLKYSQTAATDPLAPMHRKRLLRLTDTVRNELGDLAASLYRECVTTEDKIKATTEYFKANYAYSLAMPKLQGGDPLISFIKRGQVGYCEYFASGAALLLRQAGVPTRYVTGFYVTEKENVVPNSWVARNNDAHAWVEAWDDEREAWQIVEATVQNALTDDGANLAGNERGLQRFVIIQHLMQALYHYGVLGILVWLYGEGGLLFQFSLSLALALGVILTIRKAKRKGKSASMSPDSNSRQWHALRKTHARLERRLKRNGLQRQPHETLLTFARNIATVNFTPQTATSIQQWYTQYNQLRYSKATGEQLEQLTHALRKLLRQLRAKRREG